MFFPTLAVVFALALVARAAPEQEYRLVRTQVRCGDGQRCPTHDSNLISGFLNIDCGIKNCPLTATFQATYHQSGLVDITYTPLGCSRNTVKHTTVEVGSGGSGCAKRQQSSGAVSFSGLTFNDCGFTQTMDGNLVHRSIVVKVRPHFNTGEIVSFICPRDITVDFWLEPVNPAPVTINPPIPTVEDELQVCIELDHKLDVINSNIPYYWHIRVSALDYTVSDAFGLGFKLTKCWVKPYLSSSGLLGRDVVFLSGGAIDPVVLFDGSVRHQNVVAGRQYEFSFGQITDGLLNDVDLAADKMHRVFCNVCLCSLRGPANKCPDHIPVAKLRSDGGRGGFEGQSIRPLYAEALLAPGLVRQV